MRLSILAVIVLAIVLSLAGLSAATHCTPPALTQPFPGDEITPDLAPESPVAEPASDATVMY
jgi:hypothetical protein